MSSLALVPLAPAVSPELAGLVPALFVLLTGGLVGMSIKNMFDSILSDDESGDASEDGGGGEE